MKFKVKNNLVISSDLKQVDKVLEDKNHIDENCTFSYQQFDDNSVLLEQEQEIKVPLVLAFLAPYLKHLKSKAIKKDLQKLRQKILL